MSAAPDDAAVRAHLAQSDPVLAQLLERYDSPLVEDDDRERDHYAALVRTIVGQQLSNRVVEILWGRLLERFGGQPPTPAEILADDPEELRAAVGLSRAKVSYLRSLAELVESGELDLDHISEMPDEKVIEELTAVRGLGEWSAHMFLMFQLGRPDVLAWSDLAICKGVEQAYGLEQTPKRAALEQLAECWRPHRTAACRVIWRAVDRTNG